MRREPRLPPPPHLQGSPLGRVQALGIPRRYVDATLEGFSVGWPSMQENRSALAVARDRALAIASDQWLDVGLLTFYGAPGSGKDHLAWSIVKSLVYHHNASALVVDWAHAMRAIRATWKVSAESEEAVLARFTRPDVLVIRELSRHAFYGSPTQHLMDVIGRREEEEAFTIITTNSDVRAPEFAAMVGLAVADRILGGEVIYTGTESYRRSQR